MEKRVLISTWQKVTAEDFNKFGTFPQASLDTVVGKLLIPDRAYTGFPVIQSGPAEVTVGQGNLYVNGRVFFNNSEGGVAVDLLPLLPAVTRRIIAITAWGVEIDSRLEPRTFLTDAETRATVGRDVATEHWRWANIGPVASIEGPDPQAPAVAADVLVIAWVTLSTAGVEAVLMAEENQAPTLREADSRLNENDIWRRTTGTRLDTLASDLANLATRIRGTAPWSFVARVAGDVARLMDTVKLPSSFTAYAADHFLTATYSQIDHVDWLAKIEEGVRFPPAAGFDAQLGLLNPFDERCIIQSNVMLPAWDPLVRVSNVGSDVELSIAQYQHQTVDMVQKTMSRMVTRYGTPFSACTNTAFWQTGEFDIVEYTFKRAGEVFQVLDTILDNMVIGDWQLKQSHGVVRLQKVWQDTVEEPYWERVVINGAVTGSVLSQTFLVSQDGWLATVDLYFSRVASTGDVKVLICETTNGAPDLSKVIAQATKAQPDLRISPPGAGMVPTQIGLQPTFLQKGGRYAIVVVTSGNHYVWCLRDSNLVSGTLFYSTDSSFFQGDLITDLAFRLHFCKFRASRVEVQLQPLQLQNGIAAIDINADCILPAGGMQGAVGLHFEVQVAGVWHALDNVDGGPDAIFIGLPPLLPFRAVFLGTPDVHAALGVASNSRVTTWRPRGDFRHISTVRTMPVAVTIIDVEIRLEAWRGDPHHTFNCRVLRDPPNYLTVVNAGVVTEVPAPDDPENSIIRTYTFTFAGPGITQYRLRFDGTTDNVLATYHVAERVDIGHS